MTERARRQAVAVVASLVLGFVGVVWLLGPRDIEDDASQRAAADRAKPTIVSAGGAEPAPVSTAEPTISGGASTAGSPSAGSEEGFEEMPSSMASPVRAPDEHQDHEHGAPARVPARATALTRSFLAAYLRWEVGDTRAAVHRALRQSATPSLGRYLLSQVPRQPGGMPQRSTPGRVTRLDLVQNPQDSGRPTVVATIDRDGRVSSLPLELERRDGAWLVAELG
jgi:hypothetical protein